MVVLHWVRICVSDEVTIPVIVSVIDNCLVISIAALIAVIKRAREPQLWLCAIDVYLVIDAVVVLEGRGSTVILSEIWLRAINRPNLIWTCLMVVWRQVVDGVERIALPLVLQLLVHGLIIVDVLDVEVRAGA